jgi:hypothetical protein
MSLHGEIRAIADDLAQAAQAELNQWVPDAEGYDEEFGYGGACDAICRELGGMIAMRIAEVEIADGGQEGDDHAFVLCRRGAESVVVDIPAHLYETGGGYSWRKREGVKLEGGDVLIEPIEWGVEIQ